MPDCRLVLIPLVLLSAAVSAEAETSPWGAQIVELGGATLLNQDWLTFKDYPELALQHHEQGRVIVSFDITADGRAINCAVKVSSRHRSLDQAVCRPLEHRAHFRPATADDGTPKATTGLISADFWMPST